VSYETRLFAIGLFHTFQLSVDILENMPIDRLHQTFRQQFFLHRFIDLHASLASFQLQTLLGFMGFIQNLFQVVFEVIL